MKILKELISLHGKGKSTCSPEVSEDWNNVYSDITLPSGDMGTIKVERIDDDKKDNDIK